MAKRADRRKKIRVPVSSRIRHSQYQVLGTPVFQENSSIDLSSGGISFRTEREYQKGDLVLLEVLVEDEPLKLLICVAWKKPGIESSYQVGGELIAIDPEHKRLMQKHLSALIRNVRTTRKPTPAKNKKLIREKQSKPRVKGKKKRKGSSS